MGNAYERVQHERLSLKLGFSRDWVREVISSPGDGHLMSGPELAVQKLALAIIERRGHNTADELEAVVESIGHERAIAVLMLIGRYVTHALMVNCLELAPQVGSPLV
jgi:hypothetical protein